MIVGLFVDLIQLQGLSGSSMGSSLKDFDYILNEVVGTRSPWTQTFKSKDTTTSVLNGQLLQNFATWC